MKDNNDKRTHILTTVVCLIPVLLGAVLYPRVPDMIATHWDGNGVANAWQPKFVGLIVYPGILVLVNLAMPFLMKIDPKYKNMDHKLKTLIQWIVPIIEMFASGITISFALGKELPVTIIGSMLMGVLFTAIGNYLPKTRQSYTLGIKLPWTLNSEENWNRTHHMAGYVWVVGGICTLIAGILGFGTFAVFVIGVILVFVPTIYSYQLYRKGI